MNGLANPTATEATGGADAPAPAQRKYARAREWTRLIAVTGAAQIAVQAIGFACGILVIRLLPTDEYALYTLANTMLGTMTLLADGGIAAGVMSQGGKVWNDRTKLGSVLVTGMALRKKFTVFSLLVATPILFYLLTHHGASWLTATLIVLSLVPAFFSALSGTLLEIVPKLRQDIAPLQRIQVAANAVRLALSGLFVFAFPFAGVAILASGVAQVFANIRLRRLSNKAADRTQPPCPAVNAQILSVVRRVLPEAAYYSLSGQITVWLISLFGNTEAIAQVGALGRLVQILSIVQVLSSTLLLPRFARIQDNHPLVGARFVQVLAILAALCVGITTAAWMAPDAFLALLGSQYGSLKSALVLMVIGSSFSLLAGMAYKLNASRGVIPPPAISIAYTVAIQVASITIFNVSTIDGVLKIGVVTAASQLALHVCYAVIGGRYWRQ